MSSTVDASTEVRPFHVEFPDEALEDMRRRISATNWPEQEPVEAHEVCAPLAATWLAAP